MSKRKTIYTCYGCPYYYAEKGNHYSVKHCGKDHFKCSYYLGVEEVGSVNENH